MRLLPPVLTLLASGLLTWLGIAIWLHRFVPAHWITDPTSFKIAGYITAAILVPAVLGVILSAAAIGQRLRRR